MLAKIKDRDGQYVWMPSVRDGQPDLLLGKPVNMSEYAPNTFTTGLYAAVYGNFDFYWICDADAMTVQVLDQPYATKNQIGYIWDYFGDGMPVIGEAFARVKLG
jgi:HK97 family phage major capsid protein